MLPDPADILRHPATALAVAAALGLGLFLLQLALLGLFRTAYERLEEERRDKVAAVIRFVAGPQTDPVDSLALTVFAGCAAATGLTLLGLEPLPILILLALFAALPVLFYLRASGQHARELELALPLALQQVANEMSAGATLETALKKVAKSVPPPADVEMGRLHRRVEVLGIDQAFTEMAQRLDSKAFTLTASVVRVGTSSGGRLVEAIKNLSRTLIELERLNRKIRTASENGRRNLYLMSVLGPVVAIAAAVVVQHETTVLEDGFGQLLIGGALIAFVAAHVIGHSLTKVKV